MTATAVAPAPAPAPAALSGLAEQLQAPPLVRCPDQTDAGGRIYRAMNHRRYGYVMVPPRQCPAVALMVRAQVYVAAKKAGLWR
jgi:hypothetical protein